MPTIKFLPLLMSAHLILLFSAACSFDKSTTTFFDNNNSDEASAQDPATGQASSSQPTDQQNAKPAATTPHVGSPCWQNSDCGQGLTCWSALVDGFPGGYCIINVNECTPESCPAGAKCMSFNTGDKACVATCNKDEDCRQNEGYVCGKNKICWPADGQVPVGGSCGDDSQCAGGNNATCIKEKGFVDGYCIVGGCASDQACGAGAVCRKIFSGGQSGCIKSCAADADCRKGYVCINNPNSTWNKTCYPSCQNDNQCPTGFGCRKKSCVDISNECSAANQNGDCPEGQVCQGGKCTAFICDDKLFEPNNDLNQAQPLPADNTVGLQICTGDSDYYTFTPSKKGTLFIVGIDSNYSSGNLVASLQTQAGPAAASSVFYPEFYHSENVKVGPSSTEVFSIVGGPTVPNYWLQITPEKATTQNNYRLINKEIPYEDGIACTDKFSLEECLALTETGKTDFSKLLPFPISSAADPFLGLGVRTDNALSIMSNDTDIFTPTSRLWARREIIMIIRNAIHEVQKAFPGTAPLGIGDIGLLDGSTPEGHPNGTHYYGANLDISYYIKPELLGQYGNMCYRQICCDAALDNWDCVETEDTSSADYGTCKPGNAHIVDVDRTALFIAKIAGSGRLRVVGVEAKIEADLIAALDKLAVAPEAKITEAQRDAAKGSMATANNDSSWIWHFNHMHFSFNTEPNTYAIKYDAKKTSAGPWPNLAHEEQVRRVRAHGPIGRPHHR